MVGLKPFNQDGAIDHAYIPRFKPYRKVDFAGGYGSDQHPQLHVPFHARRMTAVK
ncbi:MAG: hypothetical protein H6509_15825 [Bryobacterales bacterium]|nr:hypothetical protein [Bryobacterales bacterium]